MTVRDLYAMCIGSFGALAVQLVAAYLAHPTVWGAIGLVLLLSCLFAAMLLHVSVIVSGQREQAGSSTKTKARSAATAVDTSLGSTAASK
jgi:hypothetical protein